MLKTWAMLFTAVFLLNACSPGSSLSPDQAQKKRVELVISAAASLQDSLNQIKTAYEKKHANIKLTFNFGSSGTLQKQIEQGAPVDLFLSAGTRQMQALADQQLIRSDSTAALLQNDLVVVVPKDSRLKLPTNAIGDLTKPSVHTIAIGEPQTVPAGGYAKETLDYYKVWETLQPKLVFAKDVRQALAYVETGNADAGFVYRTDALTSDKVKVILSVDDAAHKPIDYPLAILQAAGHPKEAEAFYHYLKGREASDIFIHYGFKVPKG